MNRTILNVLALDDTELGAGVRHAVARGHGLTLMLGGRPPTVAEMPCDVCMKPEPNREDCATCGDEDKPELRVARMEACAWDWARGSADPSEALRWVNVAALCMRIQLALRGAAWPI